MLVDAELSDQEIHFLELWLRDNEEIRNTWPGNVIYERVQEVLGDGVITADERAYLTTTLSDLIGGSMRETGAAGGAATTLPVNDVPNLIIPGNLFCFTGTFVFGTRTKCQNAVIERGGMVADSITKKLDYLVIGTLATREWKHTSHGLKIEKAMDYQRGGAKVLIVSEDQWISAL